MNAMTRRSPKRALSGLFRRKRMCCSTRRPRSLRVSEDTPPQCLLPSRTGGPRGARVTGHVRATGRRTAPSGSPLPRRRMTTQMPPVPLQHSQRPQPLLTAAVSGRDELLSPVRQFHFLDRSHKITWVRTCPSPSAVRARPTFDNGGIGTSRTGQEHRQHYSMLVTCIVSYPVSPGNVGLLWTQMCGFTAMELMSECQLPTLLLNWCPLMTLWRIVLEYYMLLPCF